MLLDSIRTFPPSASHRYSTATGDSQQFTHRLQRLEQNMMPPSGKYVGSMSSQSPSVSCRSPVPSTPISYRW